MKKNTTPTQQLLAAITHINARAYKGGIEIRFSNLDKGKETVQKMITQKAWPIEIFNIDISLRSLAIREIAQPEERHCEEARRGNLTPIVHPLTA